MSNLIPYSDFIASKHLRDAPVGLHDPPAMSDFLYGFQKDITKWACRMGRAAIFADCGLGKTLMQLEWATHMCGKAIIFAPLAVAKQTEREARRFNYSADYRRMDGGQNKIVLANYEMEASFNPDHYSAVVLDESSILKNVDGKTKKRLMDRWRLKYRLCCSATPAPNDTIELQSHSEFLGFLSASEMQSRFFINDGNQTQKYRLKRHAIEKFWDWVAGWAVFVRKPSDIGYSDDGFDLPPMRIKNHLVETNENLEGFLFHMPASSLSERISARRKTAKARADEAARLANASNEQFIVWCGLNSEAEMAAKLIHGAVNVQGSDSLFEKEKALDKFATGEIRVLVSKPKIAGLGMNFQNCHNVIYLGLSDSFEQLYQSVRRCWRFGQKHEVNVHIVTSDIENAVVRNIEHKEKLAAEFYEQLSKRTKETLQAKTRTGIDFDGRTRTARVG